MANLKITKPKSIQQLHLDLMREKNYKIRTKRHEVEQFNLKK